jgi:hypothetical protein
MNTTLTEQAMRLADVPEVEQEIILFFRTLNEVEKDLFFEALHSRSDEAFMAFESLYRRARGLSEAETA